MMIQSLSSFVLKSYAEFIEQNIVITYFLTMLVGAGGNCGAEASSHLIQMLAKGNVSMRRTMIKEALVGTLMAGCLMAVALFRVLVFNPEATWAQSLGITMSLGLIVLISTVIGAGLPFLLHWLSWDPAHAGSTVQVVMDLMGVFITCVVCFTFVKAAANFY